MSHPSSPQHVPNSGCLMASLVGYSGPPLASLMGFPSWEQHVSTIWLIEMLPWASVFPVSPLLLGFHSFWEDLFWEFLSNSQDYRSLLHHQWTCSSFQMQFHLSLFYHVNPYLATPLDISDRYNSVIHIWGDKPVSSPMTLSLNLRIGKDCLPFPVWRLTALSEEVISIVLSSVLTDPSCKERDVLC